MEIIFYILILVPLFFIAFFAGFIGYRGTQKTDKEKQINYYFKDKENNDYAEFLNYDGSKNKGDK